MLYKEESSNLPQHRPTEEKQAYTFHSHNKISSTFVPHTVSQVSTVTSVFLDLYIFTFVSVG